MIKKTNLYFVVNQIGLGCVLANKGTGILMERNDEVLWIAYRDGDESGFAYTDGAIF